MIVPQKVELARHPVDIDEDGHHHAAVIIYDPTSSGLVATDVQAAIDEVAGGGGGGGTSFLDWVFVTDPTYGAVGDDSTDDTTAIQDALDATPEGGVCYFPVPASAYKITAALMIPHAMTLKGGGSFIGQYTKIRQATANTDAFVGPSATSAHIVVEGLQIVGTIGGQTSGVAIKVNNSVLVSRCLVQGFYDGLRISSASSSDAAFYSSVEYSFFDSATRASIALIGIVNNFSWLKCRVNDSAYGVYVPGGAGGPLSMRFVGGSVEGLTTAGMWIDGTGGGTQHSTGLSLTGIYFEQGNGIPDIVLGANTTVYATSIVGCSFTKASLSGTGLHVSADRVNGLLIEGCEFQSSSTPCISVDGTHGSNVVLSTNHNLNSGTYSLPASSFIIDPTDTTTGSAVGTASAGSSKFLARIDHGHALGGTAGGDLSGTYPNPSVVDDSHSHTASTLPAAASSGGASDHVHVVGEAHTSDGSTTAFLLDNEFDEGSVAAYNLTSGIRLSVVETLPNTATVGAAGSAGNSIVFDYIPVTA